MAAVAGRVLRVTLLPRHRWDGASLDVTALAFTGAAVLAVGFAAALLPALYAARNRRLAARVGGGRDGGFPAMGDPGPTSFRRSRNEVLTGQPGGSLYPSG